MVSKQDKVSLYLSKIILNNMFCYCNILTLFNALIDFAQNAA